MKTSVGSAFLAFAALTLGIVSCAPGGESLPSTATAPSATPKVLRIGMFEGEPQAGIALFGGTPTFIRGGLGAPEHTYAFHAGLTVYNDRGDLMPWIAQKVPTLEDGDWQVSSDGRMEVTWKLRPDVKWHDGTAATTADFTLGVQIALDRDLPIRRGEPAGLISEVLAPDQHTLIVRWKEPYTLANVSGPTDISAAPAHLMRELYRSGDKQAFTNHRYWTSEFVGLGPYRLGDWVLGDHLEGLAFDDYFLGRPRIDRIVVRYFNDPNALYLAHLSNDVDMTPMGSFQALHFIPFKTEWEPSGAGTALAVFAGSRNYRFQFRYPDSPWSDRRVRRAMVHMLDKQGLADGLVAGLSKPADTVVFPGDPLYQLVEQRGLPKYPFDLVQAQRLMEEAGWTRGGDGMYRSAAGQPFAVDIRVGNSALVREASAVAGLFKAAGVETTAAVGTDGEIRYTFPGIQGGPLRDNHQDLTNFITSQIGSEANRWTGSNRGGYSNPEFDRLYALSLVTLDSNERRGLIADMLKIEAEDVASIHLFSDMAQQTVVFRKGVRGPGIVPSAQLINAWNIHTWEME